jgi:hypothetical protein
VDVFRKIHLPATVTQSVWQDVRFLIFVASVIQYRSSKIRKEVWRYTQKFIYPSSVVFILCIVLTNRVSLILHTRSE